MIDLRDEFVSLDRDISRVLNAANRDVRKTYRGALDNIRSFLREAFDKYAVGDELTYAEMQKYDRLKDLQKKIRESGALLMKDAGGKVKTTLRQTYRETWRQSRGFVESASGRSLRGKLRPEAINNAIFNPVDGLTLDQRLENYRREIVYKINQSVVRGLQEGKSYTAMSRELAPVFSGDLVKAQRIVRTEGHRVMEAGKNQGLQSAVNQGVKLSKEWVSSDDERVRSSHEEMDGKIVAFDRDFLNPETGGKGPYPGEMGTAADDINCRCIVSYRVIE